MLSILLLFLCFTSQLSSVLSKDEALIEDEIVSLPGLISKEEFRQFSGYLDAANNSLFYWLVESESNPAKDPLILWLNGGPGCSSLVGLLAEIGPWLVKESDNGPMLKRNPFSWNRLANVLFLETPAGVGFSDKISANNVYNDNATAEINYLTLQSFFKKHSRFIGRRFYIAGESYAGVYIPFLSKEILKRNELKDNIRINLKGIAIGNGAFNEEYEMSAMSSMLNQFGIDNIKGNEAWISSIWSACQNTSDKICSAGGLSFSRVRELLVNLKLLNVMVRQPLQFKFRNLYNLKTMCRMSPSTDYDFFSTLIMESCFEPYQVLHDYLNDVRVQRAIHVLQERDNRAKEWQMCRPHILFRYKKQTTMEQTVRELLGQIEMIFYYGEDDAMCSAVSGKKFVADLKLQKLIETPFYLNGLNIVGHAQNFDRHVKLVVINNAGHMAAMDQPAAVFDIFQHLIN